MSTGGFQFEDVHTAPGPFTQPGSGGQGGTVPSAQGGSSGEGGLPTPSSIFHTTMAGWMVLAGLVDEVAPPLANVLFACGSVVQAAAEANAEELLERVSAVLRDMGISTSASNEIAHSLWTSPWPLGFETARSNYESSTSELTEANRALLKEAPERFVQGVALVASNVLEGKFEHAADIASNLASAVELRRNTERKGEWRMQATLERPCLVPEGFSIWCVNPRRRWAGDRVTIYESTYSDRLVPSPSPDGVKRGGVKIARDLDEDRPNGFQATIRATGPTTKAYALQAVLVGRPGASLIADIARHQDEIVQAVNAAGAAGTALAAVVGGLPLATASGLVSALSGVAIAAIVSTLNRLLSDTIFPTWVVLQTSILSNDDLPFSLVLVTSPNLRTHLFTGVPMPPSRSVRTSDDYRNRPEVDFWDRARWNRGPSVEPSSTEYPKAVFPATVRLLNPVVINDGDLVPNAMRVFLPLASSPWREGNRQPAYAAAVRVETFWQDIT
jgi:hypothetical protein